MCVWVGREERGGGGGGGGAGTRNYTFSYRAGGPLDTSSGVDTGHSSQTGDTQARRSRQAPERRESKPGTKSPHRASAV